MATFDARKNFAKVTVSTGYDASATSIVLATGHGARLPQPSTDGEFNLVWWNNSDYGDPTDDPNREIVRCTARSADTLTVTRAQEGESASIKNVAGKTYRMALTITKKVIDDIIDSLGASSTIAVNQTAHGLAVGDVVRNSGVANTYVKANAGISIPALADSNSSSRSADGDMNTATPMHAQSFTGGGGKLASVKVMLRKAVSPTGTITAQVYAHSGTYGTSSVPTGSALASSTNSLDAATKLDTNGYYSYKFDFDRTLTLTDGTYYCMVVSFSGTASGSNKVLVPYSTGGHSGNRSYYDTSWHADATNDLIFQVYEGENVTAASNAEVVGIVTDVTDVDNFTITTSGMVDNANAIPPLVATIDSYSEINQNTDTNVFSTTYPLGQTFYNANKTTLSSAKFYLKKTGSPTGNMYLTIYAHTGQFGVTGTPTGSVLATSGSLSVTTLTGSYVMTEFTFTGSNKIVLEGDTSYCLVLNWDNVGSFTDYITLGRDNTTPTSTGRHIHYYSGAWYGTPSDAHPFYVYGETGATNGSTMFLSPTSAGDLQGFDPVVSGQISKPLAIVTDEENKMLFINWRGAEVSDVDLPSQTYITVKMGTDADGDDNKTFSLTTGSFTQGKYLSVYKNGALQEEGASADYQISGTTKAVFNSVVLDTDKITLVVRSYTVEGMDDPTTTAGDVIYRNATIPTRLAIGTNGQFLGVNSGNTAPEWQTVTVPVKATGTELNTGTDDAKFATSLALENSDYIREYTPHSVENFTGNDTLTAAESGKTCTNAGASGAIELTLPTAATGLTFSFVVSAAQYLRINFAAGDNGRYLTTTSATAGYFRANTAGNFISITAVDATTWQVTSLDGTWTVDA